MDFQLQIKIDAIDVERLTKAKNMIAIARDASIQPYPFFVRQRSITPVHRQSRSIIWCAFDPRQLTQLSWSGDYMVYAASCAVKVGGTIEPEACNSAQPQYKMYTFGDNIFHESAKENGEKNTYYIINESGEDCIMGLAQAYCWRDEVSDAIPIQYETILNGQATQLYVAEKLRIFLSPPVSAGEIIPTDTSGQCMVDFSRCKSQKVLLDHNLLQFRADG